MTKGILFAVALVATMVLSVSIVSSDTGGPDAGGYRFVDSNSLSAQLRFADHYVDIRTPGNRLPCSDIDDCLALDIPIGFQFVFYGLTYTQITVGDNGGAVFGQFEEADFIDYTNYRLPSDSVLSDDDAEEYVGPPSLLPFWDDFHPCDGNGIYYDLVGTAPNRRFVVQWHACHYVVTEEMGFDCKVNFQLQLIQGTNEILFLYEDAIFGDGVCDAEVQPGQLAPAAAKPAEDVISPAAQPDYDGGADASVGIQRDEDVGLEYAFNGVPRLLTDGLVICFYPGQPVLCAEPEEPSPIPEPSATPERPRPAPRPPSIGAGLSGLFNGQPTPLPTAPAAVAPAATSPVITPPRTGDAGIADSAGMNAAVLAIVSLVALGSSAGLLVIRSRR